MSFINIIYLLEFMLILYVSAAFFAVVFYKADSLANIVPNIICVSASALGIIASVLQIISGNGRLSIIKINLSVPLISINLIFDALSAFFIFTLSVLVFCISIFSIGYLKHYYNKRNIGLFNFFYCGFILSMLLVFMAGNMVFFLISWEAMALISYFLVVFESEQKENQKAGTLYVVMTHVGTAFLIIAFMIILGYTGSFDMFTASGTIPDVARNVIFILFLIGFGTKAGIIPLHIWLPYAHPAAASNVSALMSGIMIKTAIYGLIRFIFGYLGIQSVWWGMALLLLGALSIVLGIAYALMETNIKKLLAYSSIENVGIIFVGLGLSMIAFSRGNMILCSLALIATLFHILNHAVFKGGLFLGAGSIQYAVHTKNIEELGGLVKLVPYTSVFILCFSLAICAILPFNGFISEWLTLQALFLNIQSGQVLISIISILCVAALAIGAAMALSSFVKMFGISFLGKPRSKLAEEAREVPVPMRVGMGVLTALCIILGLFPSIAIRLLDKISSGISGISIASEIKGKFLFVSYPIKINSSEIMPVCVLVMGLLAVAAIAIVIKLAGQRYKDRKYRTWDCGYKELNPRMQYSATGFSKPFRIVFRIFFRPGRELQIDEGKSPYYPGTMKYSVSTEKLIEKYLYRPMLQFMQKASKKMKFSIQTGSIHIYLIYIFITLLVLMLYSSLC